MSNPGISITPCTDFSAVKQGKRRGYASFSSYSPFSGSLAPHSEDEAAVNALVDRLRYEDCRALFRRIRFEKRDKALDVVKNAIGV
jgi:hypothetical protein